MGNDMAQVLETIFGGDAPQQPLLYGQVAARACVVYLIGLALVRIGKSRLLSHATALDVILAVILGSLLSRGITGSASISGTTVACVMLIAVHWFLTAVACRWHRLGNLIKGHTYLVVDNGRIDWKAMRRSHISEQDLLEELRLNANIEDVSRIKRAYKERSGQISGVRHAPETELFDVGVENGVKTVRIEIRTR
jgi:uncharacterized membrane protein YcaP (DUF421 family)